MKAFGGFVYRLQLNVRNVLNEDDPIPVTALTTGEIVRIALQNLPRCARKNQPAIR